MNAIKDVTLEAWVPIRAPDGINVVCLHEHWGRTPREAMEMSETDKQETLDRLPSMAHFFENNPLVGAAKVKVTVIDTHLSPKNAI